MLFDHFNGQLTDRVNDLESYDIHAVLVPPNCTDRLQPLDMTSLPSVSFDQNFRVGMLVK